MGLFDFFRDKSPEAPKDKAAISRNEFARLIMNAMQVAGLEGLSYNEKNFSLKISQQNTQFFLQNTFDEYLAAAPDAKANVIDKIVAIQSHGTPSVSEDWEEAAPCLIPLLRSRTMFENVGSYFQPEAEPEKSIAWQPLATSLGLAIGYDLPATVSYVQKKSLSDWGMSYEETLSRASENLLARSQEPFIEISPGLFQSPWKDSHDPARMVIPEVLSRLHLKGRPVVGIPHRDILLVAGSEDVSALIALSSAIEAEMNKPRANTSCAYILDTTGWKPFVPAANHPAYLPFLKLFQIALARDYEEQGRRLEAQYQKTGEDIFVAKVSLIEEQDTKAIWSYAVWSRDIATLLPRTDKVVLYDPLLPEKQRIVGRIPWKDLEAKCPELTKPVPVYPERYFLKGFPSQEIIAEVLKPRTV